MTDFLTSAERSELMSRIRGKDTSPEQAVRRLVHSLGYRFRLHRRDLPGTPDLVFPSRRKAIFVHGCFWHRHEGCKRASLPSSNTDYWVEKFRRNTARDVAAIASLSDLGWASLIVWQCELKAANMGRLSDKLSKFLEPEAFGCESC